MQSGESEPLDLGLPISNLDGLRVVLDIADHTPGIGKEHTHTHAVLSFTALVAKVCCSVSLHLPVSVRHPAAPSKSHGQASTSRNQSATVRPPPASYSSPLLTLECPVTHWMYPSPGWWCHATKCLHRCPPTPMPVCNVLQVCAGVWSVSLAAYGLCVCVSVFMCTLMWGWEPPRHTVRDPDVPLLWSACGRMWHQRFSLVLFLP